jgi:prepilin-type N-terminal cleavage/methylation domain-containing protein
MSTAERNHQRSGRAAQRGYTFLEMIITLVIVSLMSLVVERVLSSTQEAERYLAAVRLATERGQKLAYEVTEIVSASRKLYTRDAVGQGYQAKLDLTRDPIAPGVRLPLFDEVNPMGPDTAGDPRTGNSILFVREADAAPCVADPATAKIRYIDTYRFVFVYPHRTTRTVVNGQGPAWDLVIWRSVPFPSRAQILAITNATEKQNVIKDLYTRYGYDVCWDPNGPVDTTFYGLDIAGNMAALPNPNYTIEEDLDVSERGRLVYADVQLAATDAGSKARNAVFSLDNPATWSPHGLEVKIVGASGSRKVWLHIVVEAQASHRRVAVMDSTMIASTRDL